MPLKPEKLYGFVASIESECLRDPDASLLLSKLGKLVFFKVFVNDFFLLTSLWQHNTSVMAEVLLSALE